jgi:predicted GNAT superfamily acetyltransferase
MVAMVVMAAATADGLPVYGSRSGRLYDDVVSPETVNTLAALPTSLPVTYRLVTTLTDTEVALGVCRDVWGADSIRDTDAYFVAATHGGYLATAWIGDEPVGAAFGFLSDRGRGLHSHMAAVKTPYAGRGIGLGLKRHQRAWAATQGIETITWTFDPLVRRNAWFNLVRLHAQVTEYRVNYYGALGDAINGNDESDRVFVSWKVSEPNHDDLSMTVPAAGDLVVETPSDIEALRSSGLDADRQDAYEWRIRMRAELNTKMENGWSMVGLTSNYQYVLRKS